MLLFGHPHIPSEKLYHVSSIKAIENTPSNSCLLFSFDKQVYELIEHARTNSLTFALDVTNLKEAILAENLDAKYLLCQEQTANSIQKAADTYVFDAKVLVHIKDEEGIEAFANEGIDGVIFSEAIIKIS